MQLLVQQFEHPAQGIELVPQGLEVHPQSLALEDAGLPLQRKVSGPGGSTPPGSPRAVRESLDSYGSYHPAAPSLGSRCQCANTSGLQRATSLSHTRALLWRPRSRLNLRIAHFTRARSSGRNTGYRPIGSICRSTTSSVYLSNNTRWNVFPLYVSNARWKKMFARSGLMTPPCGVPVACGSRVPSSTCTGLDSV